MKTCLSCLLLLFCLCSAQAKTRKAVYIVLDGIPADYIERVRPTHIFDIARQGGYARAYTGGEVGGYSQTPTISAIGYMNILTGTWMNKHRVNGNSNLKPNYNYWSIFRLAKAQKKPCKTALFSSWTDNRTVLIGAGKPETGNLTVDYVYDGYELDEARFPPRPDQLHIFSIDSVVSHEAAQCIRRDAPRPQLGLSVVYRLRLPSLRRRCLHGPLRPQDRRAGGPHLTGRTISRSPFRRGVDGYRNYRPRPQRKRTRPRRTAQPRTQRMDFHQHQAAQPPFHPCFALAG